MLRICGWCSEEHLPSSRRPCGAFRAFDNSGFCRARTPVHAYTAGRRQPWCRAMAGWRRLPFYFCCPFWCCPRSWAARIFTFCSSTFLAFPPLPRLWPLFVSSALLLYAFGLCLLQPPFLPLVPRHCFSKLLSAFCGRPATEPLVQAGGQVGLTLAPANFVSCSPEPMPCGRFAQEHEDMKNLKQSLSRGAGEGASQPCTGVPALKWRSCSLNPLSPHRFCAISFK